MGGDIILIVLAIISFILSIKIEDRGDSSWFGVFAGIFIVYAIVRFSDRKEPEPIDVYRGKTELQVEGYYKEDSIFVATDSTVVFK